ncbi:MAG: hypothetical protein AB7Y46_11395 [Armatimonadota bacterium]
MPTAADSPLALKPDFCEAAARWEAFWGGEMLDRPPVVITCPNPEAEPAARPTYWTMLHDPIDELVARMDAWVASRLWGGDAMPQFSPGFGPDIFAAFLGAELEFSRDQEHNTSWAVSFVEDWRDVLPLRIDEGNRYWTRMRELTRRMAEVAAGRWLVSHLDLHSNLDALESIRGATRLCVDLYDYPDLIEQANDQVRSLYAPIYDTFYADGAMDRTGTGAGWIPAFCAGKCNAIQCDFAALIGPEHFRRFVVPDLVAEAEHLDHCIYHWDGPTALVHMDDLMAIDAIDCIQWVPGSGSPPLVEWLDLLEEVQRRGKSVMVYCSVDEVPIFHKRLRPERLFYSIGAQDREQMERTLSWIMGKS